MAPLKLPDKHKLDFTQFKIDVGPACTTLAQHQPHIGSITRARIKSAGITKKANLELDLNTI